MRGRLDRSGGDGQGAHRVNDKVVQGGALEPAEVQGVQGRSVRDASGVDRSVGWLG
jgi:hypothetical protein